MRHAALVLALAFLAVPAWAQQAAAPDQGGMAGMDMGGEAMRAAMERMEKGMDIPASGNPDLDFVRMMIPHHQGAVDMAKAELADGKDPQIRELARKIVAAQEKEIAFMRQWLQKHGH